MTVDWSLVEFFYCLLVMITSKVLWESLFGVLLDQEGRLPWMGRSDENELLAHLAKLKTCNAATSRQLWGRVSACSPFASLRDAAKYPSPPLQTADCSSGDGITAIPCATA